MKKATPNHLETAPFECSNATPIAAATEMRIPERNRAVSLRRQDAKGQGSNGVPLLSRDRLMRQETMSEALGLP